MTATASVDAMGVEIKKLPAEQLTALMKAYECGAIEAIEKQVRGRIFLEWSRLQTTEEQRDRLYWEVQALNRLGRGIRVACSERKAEQ